MYDIIIRNGTVINGTGQNGFKADVAVKDGCIVKIGSLQNEKAEKELDASGCFVTPGFFDMHSHADLSMFLYPDAESLIGQGVTSVFTGHCGMGMAPLDKYWRCMHEERSVFDEIMPLCTTGCIPSYPAIDVSSLKKGMKRRYGLDMNWRTFGEYREFLRAQGVGVNMLMLIGHQNIRQTVMGIDAERTATQKEIDAMKEWIIEAMEAGAYGLSFGLDYEPCGAADENELIQLAECIKPYDGILTAHVQMGNYRHGREDDGHRPIDGIKEFLEIGLKTGVHIHISHICHGVSVQPEDKKMLYHMAKYTLSVIKEYREKGVKVTWDVLTPKCTAFYYCSELCKILVYYIKLCGGKTPFRERLQSEGYREYLAGKLKNRENISFPRWSDDLIITSCIHESWVGKTIRQIAEELAVDPEYAMINILCEDMDTCYEQPPSKMRIPDRDDGFYDSAEAVLGLDNMAYDYDYEGELPDMPPDRGTPTTYCGMVEFIKSRQEQNRPIEEIIMQLTGNAAKILGLTKRGYVKEGCFADLVVIDLENLQTNKNMIDPRSKPEGIEYVIINGKVALDHGNHFHVRSGMVEDYKDRS